MMNTLALEKIAGIPYLPLIILGIVCLGILMIIISIKLKGDKK